MNIGDLVTIHPRMGVNRLYDGRVARIHLIERGLFIVIVQLNEGEQRPDGLPLDTYTMVLSRDETEPYVDTAEGI